MFWWMFIKWPKIVKSSVNSMPTQKKCSGPQTFYCFFENFSDCSHYPCWNNVYLLLPSANICHLLKAIHNTTKYAPYLRWSCGKKLNCLVQMNFCAMRLIIIEMIQWISFSHGLSCCKNGKSKTAN